MTATVKPTKTKFAGVYKREGKRGTSYQVYVTVDGKQQVHTRPTLAEARALKQDMESAQRRGERVDLRDRRTVAEFAAAYTARLVVRGSTREHQESILRRHVDGTTLGGTRLVKVRKEHVDAWIAELFKAGMQRSTISERAGYLRSVLRYAVENGDLASAPPVKLPKAEQKKSRRRTQDIHPVTRADTLRLAATLNRLDGRAPALRRSCCRCSKAVGCAAPS